MKYVVTFEHSFFDVSIKFLVTAETKKEAKAKVKNELIARAIDATVKKVEVATEADIERAKKFPKSIIN